MSTKAKVVLVTGSSRGIGAATVAELASRGFTVYASMRDPTGRNAAAADTLSSLDRPGRVRIVELDVTSEVSVTKAVTRTVADEGRLDVVINNAGVMNLGLTEAFTPAQLRHQMDVNYVGPARMFRAALPVMRTRGEGLFVTVSSLAGRVLFPFLSTYNPSKFAVEALAEMYRYELSRFGIDSGIVQPGPFSTGIIAAAPRPDDPKRLDAYGDLGQAPEKAMDGFREMMDGNPDHDPSIVAADIARLIDLPFGHRPLRTVSGESHGIERINRVAEEVQRELLAGMGLSDLDPSLERSR